LFKIGYLIYINKFARIQFGNFTTIFLKMAKTIIISNRLPISISRSPDNKLQYKPSAGGLATGLGSIYQQGDNLWIGWPGIYLENEEEELNVKKELKKENMAPVYLTQEDIELFYEGFSNSTLWPLFHYVPKYATFNEQTWVSFKKVNEDFAKTVLEHAEPDDLIWIHDYQLLLLPKLLRDALPNATIGFFQHIPFPSYEIFRILPWRKQLLEGMLGADLIGFHTFDDVRHFLSASSRIIGIDNKMGQLRVKQRLVQIDSFSMGIDYDKFVNELNSEEVIQEVENYKQYLGNKKLIISIDRLDYSKGIPDRLIAFDQFLEQHPEYREEVSLVMVVVPSRDQVELYKKLKNEIDELVGRINGKYGNLTWSPIHYFYRGFPFHTIVAFYTMSDIALVTPLRDGMNLVSKEFIASKTDKSGVLILSEMAGAAKELSEALIINPFDTNEMVNALYQACTMPIEEQNRRIEELQHIVKRYDIHNWVQQFMNRLQTTKEKQSELVVKSLSAPLRESMIDNYRKSKKRLLFLDYDGTLMPFNKDPEKVKPDEELLNILEKLNSDPKNKVVIISGRDKESLDKWLSHLSIDMVAEHGVWLKEGRPFWSLFEYMTDEWKADIKPILEMYVDRTPGSFIEHKDYSLVWHYRKADVAFGELRSRELINHLQYMLSNSNIKILEGDKVIEVKNAEINKGKAAIKWLQQEYDFILSVGDDWTDEDTFNVMPESAYTLKVGYSPTLAKYNIESQEELRVLLNMIASI
jgi:trehalose 6-phosphate synthase/phosphatase